MRKPIVYVNKKYKDTINTAVYHVVFARHCESNRGESWLTYAKIRNN